MINYYQQQAFQGGQQLIFPAGLIALEAPLTPQGIARWSGAHRVSLKSGQFPGPSQCGTCFVPGPGFSGAALIEAEDSYLEFDHLVLNPGNTVQSGILDNNSGVDFSIEMDSCAIYGGTIGGAVFNGSGANRLQLNNIFIDAGAAGGAAFVINGTDTIMSNCRTNNGGSQMTSSDGGFQCANSHFSGSGSAALGTGIWSCEPGSGQSVHFTGCEFDSPTHVAFIVHSGAGAVRLSATRIYENASPGLPILSKTSSGVYKVNGMTIDAAAAGCLSYLQDVTTTGGGDSYFDVESELAVFTGATSGTLSTFFGNANTPGRMIGFRYNGVWQPEIT